MLYDHVELWKKIECASCKMRKDDNGGSKLEIRGVEHVDIPTRQWGNGLVITTRLIDTNNTMLTPLNNNNRMHPYHAINTVLIENRPIHESYTIGFLFNTHLVLFKRSIPILQNNVLAVKLCVLNKYSHIKYYVTILNLKVIIILWMC